MMDWNGHWQSGNWLAMSLVMVVCVALIATAVVVVVRSLRDRDLRPTGEEARRVLDQRFARGEISEDEYTRRRELLHTA